MTDVQAFTLLVIVYALGWLAGRASVRRVRVEGNNNVIVLSAELTQPKPQEQAHG